MPPPPSSAMSLRPSCLPLGRGSRRSKRHREDVVPADAKSLTKTSGRWRSTLWRNASAMDGKPSKHPTDGKSLPAVPRYAFLSQPYCLVL